MKNIRIKSLKFKIKLNLVSKSIWDLFSAGFVVIYFTSCAKFWLEHWHHHYLAFDNPHTNSLSGSNIRLTSCHARLCVSGFISSPNGKARQCSGEDDWIAKEDDFMETQEVWKMESTFFLVIVSKIPPRSLIQKGSRGSSA